MKAIVLLAGLLVALAASSVRSDDLPEWQDPAVFARGQEPGAAPLMSFASTEEAPQWARRRPRACTGCGHPTDPRPEPWTR